MRRLIAELEEELRLVGASDTQKQISATLRRANVDAASKEGQQIAQLVTQIEAETEALGRQKKAQEAQKEALTNLFDMGAEALENIADRSVKAEDAVKKLAAQLALAAAQAALLGTGPLAGLFGGGFIGSLFGGGFTPTPGAGLWAKGGAFSGGNVIPFARGGIVSQPTLFPMARGAGLMGEAGPEAIMPLRRMANGRLGVEANGKPTNGNAAPAYSDNRVYNIDARGAQQGVGAEIRKALEEYDRQQAPVTWHRINDDRRLR